MESLFLNNIATSVADNIIVPTSILTSATPVDNQVLSYLAGQFKWATITSGGGGSGTVGNLTESTSNVLTINGGVGAVNGLGTTIKVNIGSTSGTLCAGNDSRLSDSRTPLSHTQDFSTITSTPTTLSGYSITDGVPSSRTINSKSLSSNVTLNANDVGAEPTLTKGNLTESTSSVLTITGGTGAVIGSGTTIKVNTGTTSNTVCAGDDSRLSDARTPLSHTQAFSTITSTPTTLAGYSISDAVPSSRTINSTPLSSNITLTTADIGDSTDKRYCTDAQKTIIINTSGTNTGNETTTSMGTLINGATAKATPVDVDMLGLMDSQDTNIIKKLSWVNIKTALKTYFDTVYTLTLLGGLAKTSNLSDLNNTTTARSNLGLGNSATKDVGTGAGTVCTGDDSRLSDARTPLEHTHTQAQISGLTISDTAQFSGVTIDNFTLVSNSSKIIEIKLM